MFVPVGIRFDRLFQARKGVLALHWHHLIRRVKLPEQFGKGLVFHERRVTQVVCHHDARIERCEVERDDRRVIVARLGLYDRGTLVTCRDLIFDVVRYDVDDVVVLTALAGQLRDNLDLLSL